MPPTAGFVSEWFVFQTVFQGFHLPNLGGRLVLALAGAGLALTAAVAFATFVKVFGIGVLGRDVSRNAPISQSYSGAVGFLGLAVLLLGVGMPVWLTALDVATARHFGAAVASQMHDGLLAGSAHGEVRLHLPVASHHRHAASGAYACRRSSW